MSLLDANLLLFDISVQKCVLRLFDIYVDRLADEFLDHGSVCAYNQTAGAAADGVVRGTQPITGQYVTINNLAHMDSEIIPPDYEKCLEICEVKIYVKGIDQFLF